MATADPRIRARARTGLAWYFGFVLLGSVPCYAAVLRAGTMSLPWVLALMWTPAAASVLARLILREGFADVSFTVRGPRLKSMLLLAWLAPAVVGLSAYGLAWLLGLERFAPPPMDSVGMSRSPALLKLAVSLAVNMTVGTALSALSAAGEELGWRGYMLTRLIDAQVPRPVLVSGVIWAAWHMPLVLGGMYAAGKYPWLSAPVFALSIIFGSRVFARVRLESGSVWPAVLLHSTWNAVIQGTFDQFTTGGPALVTSMWTGESGLLVGGFTALYAWLFTRGAR